MLKYSLNINTLTSTTGNYLTIPLTLDFDLTGKDELIEKEFVDIETEKAINPILDYEKVRFVPVNNSNVIFNNVIYNITFSGGVNNYTGIGFTDDDIKFRRNNFKLSFLKLNFYDTDRSSDQRLISFLTLFPKITDANLYPLNSTTNIPSSVKPASQINTRFTLDNPLNKSKGVFEGFYIYHYKDEVTDILPKELFMKAAFNNAKNGKSINLMTSSTPQPIDTLVNKLHTKYILKRNNNGFFYEIDLSYSNNVSISGSNITVNLYQIQST